MSRKSMQPYLESGTQLVSLMTRYAKMALIINPLVLKYNKVYNDTYENHPKDLTELNKVAGELLKAYKDTEYNAIRAEVRVLKLKKRIWMKVDVAYRDQFYKSLDYSRAILEDAIKSKKRTKRLDAAVTYPYWLW